MYACMYVCTYISVCIHVYAHTPINVKKTCQFKTWCKGDKSNIENSTDHFGEDTRQNALAALTNLGHVTPFLLLGPPRHLTIQWVREITSLDSKLPDQTEVHIGTVLSSDPLAERNRPHSSRTLFAQWRR